MRARVGTVVLACAGSLLALMRASFPEVTVVDLGGPLPPFDLHLPMMSLPLAFHTGADTIPARVPYLTAPARARPPLIDRSGGLTHVGVAWRGSAGHEGDSVRSVPLAALAPLREVAGIRLYSLQKGPDEGAFHGPARHGPIIDLAPFITDFADTAGWIGDLDLVVSVDTAVAHLAGALGRPVWIMLASVPDWRWQLDRTDSPWYPSATLFRQDRRGDWTTVVGTIAEALRRSVSA